MPNCNWYGDLADHRRVLDFVFDDDRCDVWESYSRLNAPLRRFTSAQEAIDQGAGGKPGSMVSLQLRVRNCSPAMEAERIDSAGKDASGGWYREASHGWGSISLQLGTLCDGVLLWSRSNHNTERRTLAWAETASEKREVMEWDFEGIDRYSGRLNRFIRKLKVAKIQSAVVLPGALELWRSGVELKPFKPDTHGDLMVLS